jgi:hypothetical protein|tara:strand:+ start:3173 stop:3547 length:375 start_codon:yes stop_codon:yes gene_type:complete
MAVDEKDITSDYDFARKQYYDLAEKGSEAIDLMMELAKNLEHPRAFEVLGTLMKQNAEVAEKLMDLQKKRKDIDTKYIPPTAALPGPDNVTNNLFVGSTADLQLALQKINDGEIIEHDPKPDNG